LRTSIFSRKLDIGHDQGRSMPWQMLSSCGRRDAEIDRQPRSAGLAVAESSVDRQFMPILPAEAAERCAKV